SALYDQCPRLLISPDTPDLPSDTAYPALPIACTHVPSPLPQLREQYATMDAATDALPCRTPDEWCCLDRSENPPRSSPAFRPMPSSTPLRPPNRRHPDISCIAQAKRSAAKPPDGRAGPSF